MQPALHLRMDAWNYDANWLNLDRGRGETSRWAKVGWVRLSLIECSLRCAAWLCMLDRRPEDFTEMTAGRGAFAALLRQHMRGMAVSAASGGDEGFGRCIKRWRAGKAPSAAAPRRIARALGSSDSEVVRIEWSLRWAAAMDHAYKWSCREIGRALADNWRSGALALIEYLHAILEAGVQMGRLDRKEAWHTLASGARDGLGARLLWTAACEAGDHQFHRDVCALNSDPERNWFWQERIVHWARAAAMGERTRVPWGDMPGLPKPSKRTMNQFWRDQRLATGFRRSKSMPRTLTIPTVEVDPVLATAFAHEHDEKWSEAAALLENWIIDKPSNGCVLDKLAYCHHMTGNRKRAHDLAKTAALLGCSVTLTCIRMNKASVPR